MSFSVHSPPDDVQVNVNLDTIELVLTERGGVVRKFLDSFFSDLMLFVLPAVSLLVAPLVWVLLLKSGILGGLPASERFAWFLLSTPIMGGLSWIGYQAPGLVRAWLDRTLRYGFTISLTPTGLSLWPGHVVAWSEIVRIQEDEVVLRSGQSLWIAPMVDQHHQDWLITQLRAALPWYRRGSSRDIPAPLRATMARLTRE